LPPLCDEKGARGIRPGERPCRFVSPSRVSSAAAVAAVAGSPCAARRDEDRGNRYLHVAPALVSLNTGSAAGAACITSGIATFGIDGKSRFNAGVFSGSMATIALADRSDNNLHATGDGAVTIDACAGRSVTAQWSTNT
jgi:hypothetical protein